MFIIIFFLHQIFNPQEAHYSQCIFNKIPIALKGNSQLSHHVSLHRRIDIKS